MAQSASDATAPRPLSGDKYFDQLDGLLTPLRPAGTERDKAGHRHLLFDQYAQLLLLYFFNPTVTSLRGVQQFTTLDKVQRVFGVRPTALGSLRDAARVFGPALLEPILAELARRALAQPAARPPAEHEALAGLIAVDGSRRPALPRVAWALWQDATHRAAKVHAAFAVRPGTPVRATVTRGSASARDERRRMATPGEFHVMDRGYVDYDRFREPGECGVLATNALTLPAELVVLAYRHRWLVELYFRWLKCILGCRHLRLNHQAGVTLQVSLAVIASLLIGLGTGATPSKRTDEMLCHYFSGWATAEEVERHRSTVKAKRAPPSKR